MAGLMKDKATAFINELGGQLNNKILCKASSHDIAGPKKKHVDFLIQVTNDSQSSITELADLIFERSRHDNWTVVMKLLITSHSLMTLGNERFLQCLATRSSTFSLDEFRDISDPLASSMSVYIPRYARYLANMCTGYRTLAMDVCRLPREDDETIRGLDSTKLLKSAGVIQQLIDSLLEVDISPDELTNGAICTVFLMLYKDVLNLYSAYNQVMINLLERFFDMKKAQCKEVIDAYRKFLTRQEGVAKFLKQAEKVSVDRNPPPEIKKAPEDLLPALETHINDLDIVKKSGSSEASPSIAAATQKLKVLNATEEASSSSGPVVPSSHLMEAQRRRFEELKNRAVAMGGPGGSGTPKPSGSGTSAGSGTPKASSQDTATLAKPQAQSSPSGLNDLLGLQVQTAPTQQVPPPSANPWGNAASANSFNPFESSGKGSFGGGGGGGGVVTLDPWSSTPSPQPSSVAVDPFSDIRGPDFDTVFGKNQVPTPSPVSVPSAAAAASHLGGVLQPTSVGPLATQQQQASASKPFMASSDPASSLSGLLDNLNLDPKTKKADYQWKPAAPSVITGGPKWQESQQSQPQALQPLVASKGPTMGYGMGSQPALGFQQPSPFMSMQQPTMMQPGTMQQPTMMQPGMMQPGMMQPGMMQPGMMQPGMMQSGMMQPGMMQPGMMQPGMMQSGMMQSGMMQPGMMQPGMMQSGMMQPGMMQPGMMQPGMMQSGMMQKPVAMSTPLWPQPSNTQHNVRF